jgi:hypothetical protein
MKVSTALVSPLSALALTVDTRALQLAKAKGAAGFSSGMKCSTLPSRAPRVPWSESLGRGSKGEQRVRPARPLKRLTGVTAGWGRVKQNEKKKCLCGEGGWGVE